MSTGNDRINLQAGGSQPKVLAESTFHLERSLLKTLPNTARVLQLLKFRWHEMQKESNVLI